MRKTWLSRRSNMVQNNGKLLEFDYVIEASCDWDGDFPLQCATMLFDLLEINDGIVIKNQYAIRQEKAEVLKPYIEDPKNCYYAWPENPEGDYCIWVKQPLDSNATLLPVLKLQGIYLSCIVPTNTFVWEDFCRDRKADERKLILTDQAAFVCNIVDEDRVLNLGFNTALFSEKKIADVLRRWEQMIVHAANGTQVKRDGGERRSEYGSKTLVELSIS